jgi:hypothetical protein
MDIYLCQYVQYLYINHSDSDVAALPDAVAPALHVTATASTTHVTEHRPTQEIAIQTEYGLTNPLVWEGKVTDELAMILCPLLDPLRERKPRQPKWPEKSNKRRKNLQGKWHKEKSYKRR